SCSSKRINNANPEVGEVGCDEVFEPLPKKLEQEATERTENKERVCLAQRRKDAKECLASLRLCARFFGSSPARVSKSVRRRARYSRINGIFALGIRLTALSRSAFTNDSMPYQLSSGKFKSSLSAW